MGKCNSKRKNKLVNVEQLFSSAKQNKTNEKDRSEFYLFVQWILSFDFYKRLENTKKTPLELSIKEDPKKSTIFKIIKAIDSLTNKDKFSVFSLYHSKKMQDKKNSNSEKETLKYLFFHLARNDASKLKTILIHGPPNNIRWLIWIAIAKAEYETIQTQLHLTNEDIYKSMLSNEMLDTIKSTVLNDINKTNTSHFFKNNFNRQSSLNNVLSAIDSYDQQSQYCLGINNIAATSLLVSDFNEEETFLLMRYFYSIEYGLKLQEFFIKDYPRINYYSFIIIQLTQIRLPSIYEVIKKIKLDKTMWIVKWLQTLFSFLKLSLSVRLWDCIIALGFNFLIKFSLGCLKYCEYDIINNEQISNENFNELIISKINEEIVIKYALSFRIGKETKIKYDQMFFTDLIRNEINIHKNEDKIDHSLKGNHEVGKDNNSPTIIKENSNDKNQSSSVLKKENSDGNNKERKNNNNNQNKEEIISIKNEEERNKLNRESSQIKNNSCSMTKIEKIKTIYDKVFKKDEEEVKIKQLNEDFEIKANAIKQMKAIYFGETTINEEQNEDETKMLCSLANVPYEQFIKQYEIELNERKQRKKSRKSLVNKRYSRNSNNGFNTSYKFQRPYKVNTHPNHSIQNDSISEDKKENLSSFVLSDDNENFYSMSKGKLSDICLSNNKGNSSCSVRYIDDNPIDENEEEKTIIVYGEEIEPILQENIPLKITKINSS